MRGFVAAAIAGMVLAVAAATAVGSPLDRALGGPGPDWCSKSLSRPPIRGTCIWLSIDELFGATTAGIVSTRANLSSVRVCLFNPEGVSHCKRRRLELKERPNRKRIPKLRVKVLRLDQMFALNKAGRYEVSYHAKGRRIGRRLAFTPFIEGQKTLKLHYEAPR